MKSKFKTFFKMIKYEFIRLFRNKLILYLLLGFSIVLLVLMATTSIGSKKCDVAIFLNGESIEELEIIDFVKGNLPFDKIIEVNSTEEGKNLVNESKADFFININNETSPVTAVIYYDGTSLVGETIKSEVLNQKNQYAYESVKTFLAEYGITLNEAYFNSLTFETANGITLTSKQYPFSAEVACFMSIVLMAGLAFSISRDNETNVSRNIKYMPVNGHQYLLSKICPYFVLGLFEVLIMVIFGFWLFKINFAINAFAIIGLSMFFVLATIMLGLVFSMLKSQIATILLDMITILLPLFVSVMTYVEAFPFVMQIVLYALPLTCFIPFLNSLMFNGVVLWQYIGLFAIQIIVYYIISLFILESKLKRK